MIGELDANNTTEKSNISKKCLLVIDKNRVTFVFILFQWCLKIYVRNVIYLKKGQHD